LERFDAWFGDAVGADDVEPVGQRALEHVGSGTAVQQEAAVGVQQEAAVGRGGEAWVVTDTTVATPRLVTDDLAMHEAGVPPGFARVDPGAP
jgi:hypothetical protein